MRLITTWLLTGLLALGFLAAGIFKLTGSPMMLAEFQTFGYPIWFMYVTGTIEVLAAIAVLVPRYAAIAASVLGCVMIGALFSHLTHGQAAMIPAPLVLLVLAVAVAVLRGRPAPARVATERAAA